MSRTTLDIDKPILEETKRLHDKEKKSMGRIVSDLLAEALTNRRKVKIPSRFQWNTRAMGAKVNLEDKEALYQLLDRESDT
ncbi:MAG: hypothetical protein ABFS45_09050 [Pseudomonadota bacterium]